jgi:hypothetical protein
MKEAATASSSGFIHKAHQPTLHHQKKSLPNIGGYGLKCILQTSSTIDPDSSAHIKNPTHSRDPAQARTLKQTDRQIETVRETPCSFLFVSRVILFRKKSIEL